MITVSRRYRMVVALDASEYSEIVLEHALDQAVRHDATDLHFIAVVAHEREVDGAGRHLARQLVEGFETIRDASGDRRARLHVRVGDPVEEVVRLAGELDADLLVIGRFGTHRRHSSTAIVDAAPCPTLVVGLTEHVVEATPQCEACVAVRAATDGERWFCDAHTGDARLHSVALLPWTSGLSHGRMW